MKYIFVNILFFFVLSDSFSQQEQLYTQFMFNKLALNPAFAGNDEFASITAIHRNQWAGFDGAPETQLLSVNLPMGNRVGLGFNISRNTIGITERMTLEGIYAYRIPLEKGHFALGASVSGRRLTVDYTDPRLFAINGLSEDLAIDAERLSKNVLNFGLGAYYNTDSYYIGFAIPRLINSSIDFDSDLLRAEEVLHLYFMGGFELKLNDKLVFMPQLLFKAAQNTPGDFDFNFSFNYDKLITAGMTIRTGGTEDRVGESLDFIFGVQATKQLMLSFAYDYTLSEIRDYENGSLEFLLHYRFASKKKSIDAVNPRYF